MSLFPNPLSFFTQYAIRNTQYAVRDAPYVSRITHHASRMGKRMVRGIGPIDLAAIAAGKAAGAGTRLLRRGGGTALPGLVAERVSPRLLRRFARQFRQGALI